MTSQNIRVKNLVMAALFTAIGVVLPQAFHMIPVNRMTVVGVKTV